MLTNINMPPYTRRYSLDDVSIENLDKTLQVKNEAVSLIIENLPKIPTFKLAELEQFEEEWDKIDKKMTSDHTWLAYYYLICMDRIGKIDSKTIKTLKFLLKDLEILPPIIYHYMDTRNPDSKNKIMMVTQPYMENMRRIIVLCKPLFSSSESTLNMDLLKGTQK